MQQAAPFVRPPLRANAEQFKYFIRGVEAILLQWTALLLVNNNRDNVALQTVHDEVLGWFYDDGEVFSDQLESYFEDFFGQTHVVIEDGSPKEVADAIYECYVKCCNNDGSAVETYEHRLELYRKINPVAQSVYAGEFVGTEDGGVSKISGGGGGDEDDDTVEVEDPSAAASADPNHPHNIMQHLANQQAAMLLQQQQQQAAPAPAPAGGVNMLQYNAAPPQTAQQQQDFVAFLNSVPTANAHFFVPPPTEEEIRMARIEANEAKPKQKKIVKDKDGWCTVQKKR